jgi:hypothetical protein
MAAETPQRARSWSVQPAPLARFPCAKGAGQNSYMLRLTSGITVKSFTAP